MARNHYTVFLSEHETIGASSGNSVRRQSDGIAEPAPHSQPEMQQPSAPDQMAPPPPLSIHPYAQYTVEDLLQQPGRESLPRLDPEGINGQWFRIQSKVGRTVSDVIKSFFTQPHPKWSAVDDDIKKTWFKMFAQKYHWSTGINGLVEREFEEKAKLRLNNIVCDWKKKWKKEGNNAKPVFITSAVWQGLVNYWLDPRSIIVAQKCSTSRNTVGPDGLPLAIPHTSGQTPFAGKRLQMAAANGGVLPPMTEVFRETHRRKNGTWTSPNAERVYNEVTERVVERQTQLSQQSPGGSSVQSSVLPTSEVDKIFEEVAPKRKGKTIGMGSIRDVPAASSAPRTRGPDDPVVLRETIATMQAEHREFRQRVNEQLSEYNDIAEVIAFGNPEVAAMLRERRRKRMAENPSPTGEAEPSDRGHQTEDPDNANLAEDYDIIY